MIKERIDTYLNEAKKEDVPGKIIYNQIFAREHIKGAKGWLDDIETMIKSGNNSGAKKTIKNLIKNLKMLESLINKGEFD
jgi:hypothetical protein